MIGKTIGAKNLKCRCLAVAFRLIKTLSTYRLGFVFLVVELNAVVELYTGQNGFVPRRQNTDPKEWMKKLEVFPKYI